ncbi:stage II sporulation protein P [Thermosyntropha lipolytica DSM 11003]|uniref:Stage II sporulation protein P n=1 Tax=Thermosyntropha lipolytica DSM 11003 TaxID=1123382 RepID=A0A1M5NML1_9FIRM|nr:stage II sporulation protein P [Thermosyntropha lipolytica]SHG90770.1 stage II sporulation protein P [Thermosyntropha lipolytica DSM 11003]
MRNSVLVIILVLVFTLALNLNSSSAHEEAPPGNYYTLVDEHNNIIHQTSIKVQVGDEYISEDNSRYEVVEIIGYTARCKYKGKEKMPDLKLKEDKNKKTGILLGEEAVPTVGGRKPTIAVYCTHSDESYVPTDGTESKPGNGGIYDVAEAFVRELKNKGFDVKYDNNNHNPHDINAYNRSRKTAVKLLRENPDAIFDVHRDAVPPGQYQSKVEGKEVTKIKLVVGRSNPNAKTNLEFAKRIKAVMDKEKPGLSNGIFIGRGDYNQDLSPRAMLIEVGAHTNDKNDAIEGIKQFADIMPEILGVGNEKGAAPAKKPLTASENKSAYGTVIAVIVVLAAALGGYYLLNQGTAGKRNG